MEIMLIRLTHAATRYYVKTMSATWTKTFYGWAASLNGKRLSVRSYRKGNGRGFVYVARVNESAATSPARPHATAQAAKAEAEKMASTTASIAANGSIKTSAVTNDQHLASAC